MLDGCEVVARWLLGGWWTVVRWLLGVIFRVVLVVQVVLHQIFFFLITNECTYKFGSMFKHT